MVSVERIRDEIDKMLATSRPSHALIPMENTGLLKLLLPELAACRGVSQKGYHKFDVLDHSLLACDYAARHKESAEIRMAALLHDIGKPACRALGKDRVYTFYRHEEVSVKMADALLQRYRYPNVFRETVCHLIGCHMFHYTDDWSDAAVRRFIIRTGSEHLYSLYKLRLADTFGMAATDPDPAQLSPLMRRVDAVIEKNHALGLKDLAVRGKDLMEMGFEPGKRLGLILQQLLEAVIEDPEQNTREKLLEIASKLKHPPLT
jgi:putative nucleotidyltransferase with HDIG domain